MVPRPAVAALSSILGAAFLVRFAPKYSVSASYTYTVLALFSVQLFALFTWSVILWPKLLSPLRHLPQPNVSLGLSIFIELSADRHLFAKGGNFFMGQFFRILRDPSGIPMQQWINEIPNDGLIRYTNIFNAERVLITSPKALGEVMVHKNYEFIKPLQLREGLGKILGVGVLLAEGEEHKVFKFVPYKVLTY